MMFLAKCFPSRNSNEGFTNDLKYLHDNEQG